MILVKFKKFISFVILLIFSIILLQNISHAEWITKKSTFFGFRNNDSDWDIKNPRIVIGDSAVHGECVHFEDTLPARLSKDTKSTVLNLGMSGNDPSHYLTYGNLFIPKLKPTDVYLVIHSNDNRILRTSIIENAYVNDRKELFDSKL